ncbi:MAG: hypothetical protein JNJ56_00010 [Ignavibacteria bacterium]|nr:hypothetical protein [Ignavibacteria bacterium]
MKKNNPDINRLVYILLLIFPVSLYFTGIILRNVQGPYYLNFYDPSYVYLINSLNMAQLSGFGVGHFDHPGTTVQVLGAFTVRIFHLIGQVHSDIAADVLSRPEAFLHVENRFFILLNSAALLFLGIFTFRITGNVILSLLIQLTPFTSEEIFYGLIIVTPDNLLVFTSVFLVALLVYYIFRIDIRSDTPFYFIILLALVCGFGLDTKLNFLPLFVISFFIVKGFKRKMIFTLLTILFFTVFFFPVISNYDKFLTWIESLFLKSGHYGKGDSTVIDTSTFTGNLFLIFKKDKFFLLIYIFTLITLAVSPVMKLNFSDTARYFRFKKDIKLLTVIFLSVNLHIFLVAKHYAQYYMIPSFVLSVFNLVLIVFIWSDYLKKYEISLRFNAVFLVLILIISVQGFLKIYYSYYEGEYQKNEAVRIYEYVRNNYVNDLVIPAFGSANQECALAFGASYAASQKSRYNNILSENQKTQFFYNPWSKKLYNISGLSDSEEMQEIKGNYKRIILQINEYGSVNDFTKLLESNYGLKNISASKVFSNGNKESVYEIRFD